MNKKSVRDLDVKGKKVLVRVDFNVPLDKTGGVADDTRIKACLPTIRHLLDNGAKVILVSHLGRPKGMVNEKFSLKPVAKRLEEIIGREVPLVAEAIGDIPKKAIEGMSEGDILLLENIRFYPGEEKNDEKFARALAELVDLYVNDAFGTAHRAHASTEGIARIIPGVSGLLMEKEVVMLDRVLNNPDRPFLAILGGAKVSDKIGVIENLLDKVDILLIGGGMANTFLKARGYNMGRSLLEAEKVDLAGQLMEKAAGRGIRMLLPVDLVVSETANPEAPSRVTPVDCVPEGWMALDIGPETAELFAGVVAGAKTVVWNGPMGVFEMAPFAGGTYRIARAMAESGAVTIVGGGDSDKAVKEAGVADRITHISTGGGATLKLLAGSMLPGVAALQDR